MIQIDGQSKRLLPFLRLDPTTRAQSLQVEVLDLCTYKESLFAYVTFLTSFHFLAHVVSDQCDHIFM